MSTIVAPCVSAQPEIVFDRRGVELMRENKALVAPWSTYLMMLMACPKKKPSPYDPNRPSFECEVWARDFMIDNWIGEKAKNPAAADPYLDLLIEVKEKGFLRSYVRHYLSRPEWEPAPVENEQEFLVWAKEHLNGHVPQTRLIGTIK